MWSERADGICLPAGVQVLDCTVRDGGFTNGWGFSVEFVRELYEALDAAGVDYFELGFANARERWHAPSPQRWQALTEELLQAAVPAKRKTRLAAMVDTWGVPEGDVLPRARSRLDLVRVACRRESLREGLELVGRFQRAGYGTALNLLAVSELGPADLSTALHYVAECPADVVYVVDSYGHLEPSRVRDLVRRFRTALPHKTVGFHGHNNRQLALANTLAAAAAGAGYVDASLLGMGRGAGNCPLELLLGFSEAPRDRLVPLLRFVQRRGAELPPPSRWAYGLPLMLTGLLNRHPREATEGLVREFIGVGTEEAPAT
ncbi:MAG: nucleoid-structuring protein H-NS [Armatimonadota bacterium]|nr:nucleoid-structuring protein H-NS [Armatimonadota bacterium]MDR7594673.1 nucleoid-structuring protein H-NS [Armatimonadota bacterium]